MLSEKLARLFDCELGQTQQKPFVMDTNFSHGFVHIAAKALRFELSAEDACF